MTTIQRVCQFCGADMGTKDGQGMTGISHGICPDCMKLSEPEQMALYKARTPMPKSFSEFIKK